MSCYFEVEPMLDIPIEEALKELPLCNEIKAGYLDNGTIKAKYLQLLTALEHADSNLIEKLCKELGISISIVANASVRSMVWTSELYRYIS